MSSQLLNLWREHWRWLVIASFLLLLPTKNAFHGPVLVMAGIGLIWFVRNPRALWLANDLRLLSIIFACIWVPMLLAVPDAINFQHSGLTTLKFLRFLFAGVFVVVALRAPMVRQAVLWTTAFLVLAWSIDACIQLLVGQNLLGYELETSRLTGIFHPKYRLGVVTAVLFPLYVECTRRLAARRWYGWFLLALPVTVVLMTGSRAAWLMLAVVIMAYVIYSVAFSARPRFNRRLAVGMLAGAMLISVVVAQVPSFATRAAEAMGVFSGDWETADLATKRRLSIWRPALTISGEHWINGVGPRSFRYVFLRDAPLDNFWHTMDPPGVTHPHMLGLEVLVEGGAIAMLGYLAVLWMVMARTWSRRRGDLLAAVGLAVLVGLFPFNVHMALYGGFWSSVVWWLIFLWIAYWSAAVSPNPVSQPVSQPVAKPIP